MINLVYDHDWKPNVWFPRATGYIPTDIHVCPDLDRQIPWIFQIFLPDLNLISPHQIDTVDSFIYPVLMQDPYLQIRSLICNHHDDFGFWSMIDKRVVQSLRDGKGYILIDATIEPVNRYDMEQLVNSLKDCTQHPNDRIHMNISDQRFVDNKNFHCHPSFLEVHFCSRLLYDPHDSFVLRDDERNKSFRIKPSLDYEILDYVDNNKNKHVVYPKKRYSLFNKRVDKHLGAVFINYLLDKHNLLKDGLVSLDDQGDTIPELFESLKHMTNDDSFKDLKLKPLESAKENTTHDFLVISKALDSVKFNLVVEAYFTSNVIDWPLLTEKIWRNVAQEKPFVVIGQKDILKWFHQLGYRSFHPLINESYDQIHLDGNRILRAFKECKKLIEMKEEDIDSVIDRCSPIFKHNHKNFEKRLRKLRKFLDSLS